MRQDNTEGERVRHTFEDIQRTVTPAALEKATLYQRRRRAFVTDMADDGTRIQGRVQGTQRRPYTVTIELGIRRTARSPSTDPARARSGSTVSMRGAAD